MRQRQQSVLDSGFLDLMGSDRLDFPPVALDQIAGTLAELAIEFITKARENLESADKISSAFLADSIVPTQVEIFGSIYQLDINVADYYDFVNKGVKGWQDEKGGNSPYQFKKTHPSRAMVNDIRKWIIKEGLKGKGKENRRLVGRRDLQRRSIRDTSTDAARSIAYNVKRKGIAPSHFWDKTVEEMTREVENRLSAALKIDIINNLTNTK